MSFEKWIKGFNQGVRLDSDDAERVPYIYAARVAYMAAQDAFNAGQALGQQQGFKAGLSKWSEIHSIEILLEDLRDFAFDVTECGCSHPKVCSNCLRYEEAQSLISRINEELQEVGK